MPGGGKGVRSVLCEEMCSFVRFLERGSGERREMSDDSVCPKGHPVCVCVCVKYMYINEKICNLEREYRDCIKSRRDKIGITRHIMMHQVLYNVHVTLFIGQLHNI